MSDTFDSVTLPNVEHGWRWVVSGTNDHRITLRGNNATYGNISALYGKAGTAMQVDITIDGYTAVSTNGTKGSLVLDGVTYTNCAIVPGSFVVTERESDYSYEITFIKDTTS